VAAGDPVPAAAEAHLASCEACRGELAALRRALAVADAEMARLLAAEPTPELAVRIRQTVAEIRALSSHPPAGIRQGVAESGPSPAGRFGWLWPATAAAATLLVALAVFLLRGIPSATVPRVAVDASRPQSAGSTGGARSSGALVTRSEDRPAPAADRQLPVPQNSRLSSRGAPFESGDEESAGVVASSDPRSNPAPAHSRTAGRRGIPPEPEVLVPPGGTEALLRFVALVHRDRLAPTSFVAAGRPSADLADLAPIDIQPLEIVPLDPAETSGT
jgi:hypothetical protein